MRNISFTRYLLLSINICLLFSCQQESIADIETKTAVVEGYLYAGHTIDSLKVTQSYSYGQTDTIVHTLDDLEITLTLSRGGEQFPLFPFGKGIYGNEEVMVVPGEVYQLEFTWQGELVSAETYIPEKREVELSTEEVQIDKVTFGGGFGGGFPGMNAVDPVDIHWDNPEGDYYYVVINNIEEDPEYINDIFAQFEADNGGRRRFSFISSPQITDVYSINSQRDLTQYGTHQIVVYRVNPEYAALYETSSNSSISLSQPPSNVKNGLGILTGVSSDTVYLEVKQ